LNRTRVSAALLLSSILAFPGAVLAQDEGELLGEIVFSANRQAAPIQRAGSSITVLDAEDIEETRATSVAEIFRAVPGVQVVESGGVGGATEVTIRGAEARHTLVLIDGVRVNDTSSARGAFDFAAYSVNDIERIEVLRGPQSALYGSDAIGGVINIITKKPEGAPSGSFTVEAGSYHTGRVAAAFRAKEGRVGVAVSGTALFTEGFSRFSGGTEDDSTKKISGQARVTVDVADNADLDFGVSAFNSDSELDAVSSSRARSRDSDDAFERTIVSGHARLNTDHRDGAISTTTTLYANGTDRAFKSETNGTDRFEGRRYGAESQVIFDMGAAGSFLAGGLVEQETADTSAGIDESQSTYSIFGLYEVTIAERLDLSFGGRLDHFTDAGTYATFRVTGAYNIFETGTKFRASVGTGAKAPTLFQKFDTGSGNPSLDAEESFGIDGGVEQTLFDDRLTINLGAFYNRFDNLIAFVGTFDPVTFATTGNFVNVDEAKTYGIEARVDAVLWPGYLEAYGSYTFLQTEDLTTGFELERRPEHEGEAGIVVTPIDGARLEARARYVGERFNRSRERDLLDHYVRVDVFASYDVTENFRVFGRVENLLGENYEDPLNFSTPDTSAYGGIRVSF
ncbi:MAG: TonB-dependent receptor, partial [Pseudomonadota bacterium]